MKRLQTEPQSARSHRVEWSEKLPPVNQRVFVDDAIQLAGGACNLARILGITRSAVYQWRPPYRFDPYMPVQAAKRFLSENPTFRKELEAM